MAESGFAGVESSIMARAAAQVEAVRSLAGVEARRVLVREQLRELDEEYAREWVAALKVEVPEVELRKVGAAPEGPPKRRSSRSRKRVPASGERERVVVE